VKIILATVRLRYQVHPCPLRGPCPRHLRRNPSPRHLRPYLRRNPHPQRDPYPQQGPYPQRRSGRRHNHPWLNHRWRHNQLRRNHRPGREPSHRCNRKQRQGDNHSTACPARLAMLLIHPVPLIRTPTSRARTRRGITPSQPSRPRRSRTRSSHGSGSWSRWW